MKWIKRLYKKASRRSCQPAYSSTRENLSEPTLRAEIFPSSSTRSFAPARVGIQADLESDPPEPIWGPYSNMRNIDPPAQNPAQTPLDTNKALPPVPQYKDVNVTRNILDPRPAGLAKVSILKGASNFILHNPIIGDNITQVQTNTNVLKEMAEYVMPGAQYDSDARDPPPQCHPGTRTQILEAVRTQIHDSNPATRIVWVYGPAGVGKSAIMQTLAEAEASLDGIFTTLFFSRPNERDDPKKTFPTLAYGLAMLNPEYRRYVGENLSHDPSFLAKSMNEQFQRLFITPFLTPFTKDHIDFGSQRWVIFLDGLDECRGEREQGRVVDLIRNSVLHCAMSSPFIWVIASRPEAHLKVHFTKAKIDVVGFWKLEVPVDSDQSSRDVEHYLHEKLSEIREQRPDSIPHYWPSETDFLSLSRASTGLFVFASTLIAYLLGGNPVARLKHVVTLIGKSKDFTNNLPQNPFSMLDLLYTQIMSDIPPEDLPVTMSLLGFYLVEAALGASEEPTPLLIASNILALEQHGTYAALRKLHSVLLCPVPHEAHTQPVKFLHASFSDFLCDSSRSGGYHIDLSQKVTDIWQCYVRVLQQHSIHRPFSDITLHWQITHDPLQAQTLLLTRAQQQWMQILVRFWAASPDNSARIRLLVDRSSLIDVFHELGPSLFFGVEHKTYPTDILTWLLCHAPSELRHRLVVETFPVEDLDLDRLFKSLCTQKWSWSWSGSWNKLSFSTVNLSSIKGFTASQWV